MIVFFSFIYTRAYRTCRHILFFVAGIPTRNEWGDEVEVIKCIHAADILYENLIWHNESIQIMPFIFICCVAYARSIHLSLRSAFSNPTMCMVASAWEVIQLNKVEPKPFTCSKWFAKECVKCEKRRSREWHSKDAQNSWNRSLFHFDDGLTESKQKKNENNEKEIIYTSSSQNGG